MYVFVQPAGTCIVSGIPHHGNGTVRGDTLYIQEFAKHNVTPPRNETATLTLATPQDILQWNYSGSNGHSQWYRGGNFGNYTCRSNSTPKTTFF